LVSKTFYKKVLGEKIRETKVDKDNKIVTSYKRKESGDFEREIVIDKINNMDNSIIDTIILFKNKFNIHESFEVVIKKEIPISAGLGGGSSNSSTVLKLLIDIAKLKLSTLKSTCRRATRVSTHARGRLQKEVAAHRLTTSQQTSSTSVSSIVIINLCRRASDTAAPRRREVFVMGEMAIGVSHPQKI
jgi:galactokinase/mevalonate kinase-like predicted kinase